MLQRLLFIFVLFTTTCNLPAQSFKQSYDVVGDVFSKGYHTNTFDGGMILITKSYFFQGGRYFTIFKTLANGDLQWSKRYEQPGNCNVSNIVQLPDSSYFFCFVELNFPEKYYITHLDKFGALIYCRHLTPPPNYIVAFDPYCIAKADGNVYVQADLHDLTNGMFSWHLFEVDINGNIVFSTCYNGSILKCLGRSLTVCANSDVLLVGYQRDSVSMKFGPVITRVDSDGVMLWSKLYLDTATSISGLSIAEADNGHIYVTASHTVPGNEVIRIETDANGNLLRTREYGHATSPMSPYTCIRTENNSQVIYGTTDTGSFVMKLDSLGNVVVAKRFSWVVPGKIQMLNTGDYTFSGVDSQSNHALMFSTDLSLASCFGAPFAIDTGSIQFQTLLIPNSYNIQLFDTAFTLNDTLWPGVDLKICGPVGVPENNMNASILIFPVPASDVIHVNSESPMSAMRLFDSTGQMIVSEQISATTLEIRVSNLSSGLYCLQLETEGKFTNLNVIIQR